MSHPQQNTTPPDAEVREDEGGSTARPQLPESLGVSRHVTETYSVGGFHYTNLVDAVAQARRMAKLEQALL